MVLALVCILSSLSYDVIHVVTLILVYGCKRLQFVKIPCERDISHIRKTITILILDSIFFILNCQNDVK
jgi:hypothetical protein